VRDADVAVEVVSWTPPVRGWHLAGLHFGVAVLAKSPGDEMAEQLLGSFYCFPLKMRYNYVCSNMALIMTSFIHLLVSDIFHHRHDFNRQLDEEHKDVLCRREPHPHEPGSRRVGGNFEEDAHDRPDH
jgi:hypothetical protein